MLATTSLCSLAAPVGRPLATRPAGFALRGGGRGGVRMLGALFGLLPDAEMVEPGNALPGRDRPMSVPERHHVLGNKMKGPWPEGHKVAVFANGCFWGSEKGIWRLPGGGIYSTAVGYAAGFTPNPTYEEACSGRTGHTEAVQVACRSRTDAARLTDP